MNDPSPLGDLWLYSYIGSKGSVRKLNLQDFPPSATFHPLGIDVIYDPQSQNFHILVINHGADRSTIEVFAAPDPTEVESTTTIRHIATLSNPAFVSPNSVVATSPTSFFVSNDHFFTKRMPFPFNLFIPLLETAFQRPRGWMDHVEWHLESQSMARVSRALSNIPFANGVAVSHDGTVLAVASSTANSVLLYDRNPDTNQLKYRDRVNVPYNPDNLSFTSDGMLLVSGHPSFSKLLLMARKRSGISPTWIVSISTAREGWSNSTMFTPSSRVGPFSDTTAPVPAHVRAVISPSYAVQTLYQSDGSGYSAASTAVFDSLHGRLFAVGLYEKGMLECVRIIKSLQIPLLAQLDSRYVVRFRLVGVEGSVENGCEFASESVYHGLYAIREIARGEALGDFGPLILAPHSGSSSCCYRVGRAL